jgi:hypothetical protein
LSVLETHPRAATARAGGDYAVPSPKVDADGNEIAGIRAPDLAAPIGTCTGRNLRRAGLAENELRGLTGSFIPFAETLQERRASGVPRRSLEEGYGDSDGYAAAVSKAAQDLVDRRRLLPADAEAIGETARARGILE